MRMKKHLPRSLQNNKGMSLIEILIVLGIIATILGMLAPRIMGGQDKAKKRQAQAGMARLAEQIEMFQSECNSIPKNLNDLISGDNCSNFTQALIKKKELEDPWGNPYVYELDGSSWTLKSLGKDGKEGGSAFNKDLIWGDEGEGESSNQ